MFTMTKNNKGFTGNAKMDEAFPWWSKSQPYSADFIVKYRNRESIVETGRHCHRSSKGLPQSVPGWSEDILYVFCCMLNKRKQNLEVQLRSFSSFSLNLVWRYYNIFDWLARWRAVQRRLLIQHSLSKVIHGHVLYRHRHVQSGNNHRALPTINRT